MPAMCTVRAPSLTERDVTRLVFLLGDETEGPAELLVDLEYAARRVSTVT